ncbi:Glycosyl hydrolases family 2, sugar binding domain [Halogranum rubrum]|uniref:Glycosyl hydrolases family 2, sugar binding domain n=1 Tax=Halogranum rubrum TaxID=553466 RepID=A0A1I4GWF9_9EURY|nr:sugar-binding domain-containing protein [Halogranum rubrum]SFL33793.1 Glycosyl hydrolases family 2, sugar binding domain [Halogranum rubrum]
MTEHTKTVSEASRSLAGEWRFSLDADDVGLDERWFTSALGDTIRLPGTTDEAKKGEPKSTREPNHLTRTHPYEGPAWYQRRVTVPERWAGRRLTLTLERTRSTRVWVDDTEVGRCDSLSTPQEYDLTDALEPGERLLTIRVDNDSSVLSLPGVQRSHMATEHTQTNWNGIVGDIRLAATPLVWVEDVRVTPDTTGVAQVDVTLGNRTDEAVDGRLSLAIADKFDRENAPTDSDEPGELLETSTAVTVEAMSTETPESAASTTVSLTCDLGDDPARWDEFAPVSYSLSVRLEATLPASDGESRVTHSKTTPFGVCDFDTEATKFVVNDRTTFLRGNVDCCIFPETGYAPTTRAAWRDVFETAREYGLNHYRFHSWCPPAAAFEAADELGVYLQPELPFWNSETALEDEESRAFYRAEAERILDAYGNHPSFVMFALGNELCGSHEAMVGLVDHCREYDGRPLYAIGAYNFLSESTVTETDDYWITASAPSVRDDADSERRLVRAAELDERSPSTTRDYDDVVDDIPIPVVSHEIGQYQFYPDFTELPKYTGVLRARNLELVRDHLEAHGMLDRAAEFAHASGRLALRCYREDVEATLRTKQLGGFQLLALQDFPGQGTALVGILDSFMDSKGVVTPETWRNFCGPTVPLARMDARTWETDEMFVATLQLAHYGPSALTGIDTRWSLRTADGETVASGTVVPTDVPQGTLTDLGRVEVDCGGVDAPESLSFEMSVTCAECDLDVQNQYDVWVYPEDASEPVVSEPNTDEPTADESSVGGPSDGGDGVVVSRAFDDATRALLAEGESVLLVPEHDDLRYAVDGTFQPDFWSYALFKRRAPPGTMGPTFDATHPLFASFPTDDHGDWQWWHLLKHSRPIVLDDAPDEYDPLVQMVDNIERNQKLGLVFETAVGDGNLLVCAIDLFDCGDEASARQFYDALTSYAASPAFDPDDTVPEAVLTKLLTS